MIILVTGCAGFIGSHLCEQLLIRDDIVYGIDIINDYYDQKQKYKNLKLLEKYKNFHFRKEDICTTNIINEVKPQIVVNIAAMAGVRFSILNPKIYMDVNITGQIHLLQQSVQSNVQLFVYASSSSVYGINSTVPFKETDQIDLVNSPYAASKKSAEIMAKLYNQLYNISVIGLRLFTVYGPRGRPDMAPFKFLKCIMEEKEFDKYGDGDSFRDYTYIDDIVSGFISAIDIKKKNICEIYNLGNSTTITLNKFIETCEKITGKKAKYNKLPKQLGDVHHTYSDITKANKDLKYFPKICIEEGLNNMYNWLKKV